MDLFHIENRIISPDIVHDYKDEVKDICTPIVIDNGSYHCRSGWACSSVPELIFNNAIAKNRGNRKDKDWDILVGNDITDIESVRWLLRTPHDFNVVVNYSIQETLFDYVFKHLGIDSEGEMRHPVVLLEPIANPSFCRKNMSELLFEAYNIPKLSYGIDCLFSHYFNATENLPETALIISCGFQSTHVLPVVNWWPDIKNALRINLGGYNCTAYMQRLLHLKNSEFASDLTLSKMEQVLHNRCYIPLDYADAVQKWADFTYQSNNTTLLMLQDQETVKVINTKNDIHSKNLLMELESELMRTKYKFGEVNAAIEIGDESPDLSLKAAQDFGCDDVAQLKYKAEKIEAKISSLQAQISKQHCSAIAKDFVECGIEKIQVPEILFQPSLVGYEQCGIKECIETVFKRYSPEIRNVLARNVFLTGGTANITGLQQRIFSDLQEIRPHMSDIDVTQAMDPMLDAWKGAARWALTEHNSWVTLQEYEEYGWEYFKKHRFSNQ